jgi:hypothetical protein
VVVVGRTRVVVVAGAVVVVVGAAVVVVVTGAVVVVVVGAVVVVVVSCAKAPAPVRPTTRGTAAIARRRDVARRRVTYMVRKPRVVDW